jgi:predicted nuclease with TOPRIM domain
MSTPDVAQDVAQGSSMRHNPTPRTDAATYPADCLGKTLVVHRDCAAALETELKEAEQIDNAANHYLSRAESAETKLTELRADRAQLERELTAAKAECDLHRNRLASILRRQEHPRDCRRNGLRSSVGLAPAKKAHDFVTIPRQISTSDEVL